MNIGQVFGYTLLSVIFIRSFVILYDLRTLFLPNVSADVVGLPEEPVMDIEVELQPIKAKKTPPEFNNEPYIPEAVESLGGLGIKKSQANSLIRDLCSKKQFTSSEELVREAIMCI